MVQQPSLDVTGDAEQPDQSIYYTLDDSQDKRVSELLLGTFEDEIPLQIALCSVGFD